MSRSKWYEESCDLVSFGNESATIMNDIGTPLKRLGLLPKIEDYWNSDDVSKWILRYAKQDEDS